MSKSGDEARTPTRDELYQRELTKLRELFKGVDPAKAQLVEGLIEDAAFLRTENRSLRGAMAGSGMILFNPRNPNQQRPVEAAKQYLKNINSYSVVIKTLNGILSSNALEEEDDLDEFE